MYMWSDECSVERGLGKAQEWCFRTAAQKWDPEMIQTYKSSRDISAMVWGSFWDIGRSDLYVLDRDFESKKHGYSANSYIEVLDNQVARGTRSKIPGMSLCRTMPLFIRQIRLLNGFRDHEIPRTDWPAYSPDLNPIERIWWALKKMVIEE